MIIRKYAVNLLIAMVLALATALPSAVSVKAAICNWTGASGGGNGWDIAGNWDCGHVPEAADTAVIDNVSPNPDPVLNGSTSLQRLDINGGGDTPRRGGILVTTGGSTLTTDILNMNGQITGPGAIVVTHTWNWGLDWSHMWAEDGTLSGGGQITLQSGGIGKIPVFGEEWANLDNYTINNYGTLEANETSMRLGLENGAAIHNYGTFAAAGLIYDNYTIPGYHSSFVNHAGGLVWANISADMTQIDTVFTNDGRVTIQKGDMQICRGGPHNGAFDGLSNAYITFGYCLDSDHPPAGDITFTSSSSITVPRVLFTGAYPSHMPNVSISGTYGPIGATSWSEFGTPTTFESGATITSFGDDVKVYASLTILGTAPTNINKLNIYGSQTRFSYAGTLVVWNGLGCSNGATLVGGGLLRARAGGTLGFGGATGTACTLDGFTVDNSGTATWSGGTDINSINGGAIINNGTFTSNVGDTIAGTLAFTNNGSLIKNGAGTTTIDVDFTNNGTITINNGNLVFTDNLTLPSGTSSTISGTMQAANLVNDGTLTVNGTIDGNLTNNNILFITGTVTGNLTNNYSMDPGHSPGLVVVEGDFTQSSTGGIGIDLSRDSGTPGNLPVPGMDYDQVQVAGAAHLAGHLQLIAGGTFNPNQFSQEIPFLTAAEGIIDEFETWGTSDFDDYQGWMILYRPTEVVFKYAGGVFLPLVIR